MKNPTAEQFFIAICLFVGGLALVAVTGIGAAVCSRFGGRL